MVIRVSSLEAAKFGYSAPEPVRNFSGPSLRREQERAEDRRDEAIRRVSKTSLDYLSEQCR